MEKELYHYGTSHVGLTPHSGRYKWHTGEKWEKGKYKEGSYDDNSAFLYTYQEHKKNNLTESQIANEMGMTVNEFRKKRSIALAEEHAALVTRAQRLKDKGYTYAKVGEIMGGPDNPIGESTIRGWLKNNETNRKDKISNVADILEDKVKKGQIIDVGIGSNLDLNVTKTTFDTALKMLEEKGYVVDQIQVEQPNSPGNYTTIKYLAPNGTTKKDAWESRGDINTITEYSYDGGKTFTKNQPPEQLSLDRVKIVYSEDGGVDRDGMVGIRRNVPDLSMGTAPYAQVRIAVDNKYYIKGMAVYDDNIPDGYDVVVYSNKSKEKGVEKALKPLSSDPDNPFGATIKAGGQTYYEDKKGKFVKVGDSYTLDESGKIEGERYSLSKVNKIKDTGDWESYKKSLPAQFLSKQSLQLINRQLDLTYKDKAEEFDEIMSLDNPIVKRKILNDFAEGVDKTARHLDAAALPRQTTKVIIPVPELKDNEIYAPTYKDGEKLALVRFPHAGRFEIPIVVVNNKNQEAKTLLGNAMDAVGINKNVAERLSGADFDGDTVLTIPVNDKVKVLSRSPLKGLEKFDPSEAYPKYEGMKTITAREKQKQMGIVTNLITDMSLQNATDDELARAVRHSMVVIDAEKHELDWKRSERENGIEALKQKYQKNPEKAKGYGGSSTLLSKLGNATVKVDEIQPIKITKDGKEVKSYTADPETGEWIYGKTNRTYSKLVKDKNGNPKLDENGNKIYEVKKYKSEVSPLQLVKDARELSSGTAQEESYANYINKMRSLANMARKEALAIDTPKADPIAKKTYENEVNSLNSKLQIALKNKPLERQAQLKANVKIENLKDTNPALLEKDKKDKLKKEKARILSETRLEVGAGKETIKITDKEWEAIQARAISGTRLTSILNNADMDVVRKMATPKQKTSLSDAKQARIKALSASGFTIAEIADRIGCSTSTVSNYLK